MLIINRAIYCDERLKKLEYEFSVGEQIIRDLIKWKNDILKFEFCHRIPYCKKSYEKLIIF